MITDCQTGNTLHEINHILFYILIRRASMSQYFDNLIWDTFL